MRFRYPGADRDVFGGLDLVLRAGQSTALVGINGAGKTTLVKLLARLHDPVSGRILVDGADLTRLRPAEWQRQVAVVFQDFAHYPLSFAENVGFGAPGTCLDTSGLAAAAGRAGALDVLSRPGRGWDTVLSRGYDGGVDLSGGQWQRIALARALFAVRHGATILVLDEPTAWLDARGRGRLLRPVPGDHRGHHHADHLAPVLHGSPRRPHLRAGRGARSSSRATTSR